MSDTERTETPRYRLMVLAIVVLALSVLSIHGALDDFARERVMVTTQESLGIYAVSRTMNAGVSVLQTSQVKVPLMASVRLGELLDPINDGVERLSTAAVWAIGSLFVQRIVLDVASSAGFKWIFLGLGLIALFAMLPMRSASFGGLACRVSGISPAMLDSCCTGLVRTFAITAVLRFIVPVFVGSGFLVSEALLQSELDSNRKVLTEMSEEFQAGNTSSSVPPELAKQSDEKIHELAALQESIAGYETQLGDVHSEIRALDEKAGLWRFVPEMLGGPSVDQPVNMLRERREDLESKIEDVKRRMETTSEELECIDRRMEGELCGGFLGRLIDSGETVIEIPAKILDMADNLIVLITNVLIALFVKNILVPILFLLVALKCGVYIVKRTMSLKLELQNEAMGTQAGIHQIERNAGKRR